MKMQFLKVDKSDTPHTVQHLRNLVDEYNSFANRELTDEFFDEILQLYSDIALWRYKYRNDVYLAIELDENELRYGLTKYSFFHNSGTEKQK